MANVTMFMDGLKCKCNWRDSSEAEGSLKVVVSEYTGTDMDGGGGIGVLVVAAAAEEREEAAVERKRAMMETVNRMLILFKTKRLLIVISI